MGPAGDPSDDGLRSGNVAHHLRNAVGEGGLIIPPCWSILPPGTAVVHGRVPIILTPGVGFGDGTHPTTRLCLQAIAALMPQRSAGWSMLDFGSGSGILAIAAARLGAAVCAVENDELALESARENARLNGVTAQVSLATTLDHAAGPFALVVANILRDVLLDYSADLVARLAQRGPLVLSGLVGTDVPDITVRHRPLLGDRAPQVYRRDEWAALTWTRT